MKRSKALLVSALIGSVYGVSLVIYFFGTTVKAASVNEYSAIGAGIATFLVLPHMFLVLAAAVLNFIAWAKNNRIVALVSGILYSVGALVFILYALFCVPSIILSFVGFANLKKIRQLNITKPETKGSETVQPNP